MDNFYLKDIELQNFRKFDDSVYKLNPHMNVFIGRNASLFMAKNFGSISFGLWLQMRIRLAQLLLFLETAGLRQLEHFLESIDWMNFHRCLMYWRGI